MGQLTILLSVDPEVNRFRFFVIELRALEDGSAERHRRWGRIGTQGSHAVEEFSTVPLAEAARAALIRRRQGRGYVRADLGSHRERRDGLPPLATWEAHLTYALERTRRKLAARREELRSACVESDSSQLILPFSA